MPGHDGDAVMVFDASWARRVSTDEIRLPSNYIGVRRVRPSSSTVHAVMTGGPKAENQQTVIYRIKDPVTGEERRMNSREKKEHRFKLKQEQKEAKVAKRQRDEEEKKQQQLKESEETQTLKRKRKVSLEAVKNTLAQVVDSHYMALPVDPHALEQEIADIKGERDGVPPVFLAPYQARLFRGDKPLNVSLNHKLAEEWAKALKQSMAPAELVRKGEDLRAMVYDLVPEVWRRMRPESLGCKVDKSGNFSNGIDGSKERLWSSCRVRPATSFDTDIAAVAQLLHQGTNLHISDGAKFGCDMLLYQKQRDRCHAFAGLRVLTCKEGQPLPTAYNMTGFVRCLNTAAKLALVAYVKREADSYQVAIVDMSLIKILPTRRSGATASAVVATDSADAELKTE